MSSLTASMTVLLQNPSPLVPLNWPSLISEKGMHPAGHVRHAETLFRYLGKPSSGFVNLILFSTSQKSSWPFRALTKKSQFGEVGSLQRPARVIFLIISDRGDSSTFFNALSMASKNLSGSATWT